MKFLPLNIQIHFIFNARITCCKHLYLCIRKRSFINVFAKPDRRFAYHNPRRKLLLAFRKLIKICVKSILRNITKNIHLFIFIPLTRNPTKSLFRVSRSFFANSSIHTCIFLSRLLRFPSIPRSRCIFLAQAGEYFEITEPAGYTSRRIPHNASLTVLPTV